MKKSVLVIFLLIFSILVVAEEVAEGPVEVPPAVDAFPDPVAEPEVGFDERSGVEWLKNNITNNRFKMCQKIIEVEKSNKIT